MYKEVSLDPQCLSEFHYYGLLRSSFGYEKGRYAVAPLRDWIKEAYLAAKTAEDLKPVQKKSITNFLNSLLKDKLQDKFILPRYRSHLTADNWLDWLELQRALRPFNSVISERAGNAVGYGEIIAGHQSWDIPPTIRVDKTAEKIVEVFSALLRLGGNLVIIDQYFSLASNPVLREIFNFLQENQQTASITIVTSTNTADPASVFEREYKINFQFIPAFKLVVVPPKFFHDRYLFTEFGALKSGQGFGVGPEQGAQSDKLSIHLCGKEECTEAADWLKHIIDDGRAHLKVLN